MMKYSRFFYVAMCLLLTGIYSQTVSAEFYKYTDENGAVRFTDDLSQVPEDQREETPAYRSQGSQPTASPQPEALPEESGNKTEKKDAAEDTGISLVEEAQRLEEQRAELDADRQKLMEQQEALNAYKRSTKSKSKARKFYEQKKAYLEQLSAYEKKRKQYETDVAAYNKKTEAMNQQNQAKETGGN